jgi:DNA-binding transcriptional LysR family regulator
MAEHASIASHECMERHIEAGSCYTQCMTGPDLNLLMALDVLLTEGSVAKAARKLRLSPSAMSRTLARLREATGDPLLVRAGRGLVASPRAIELRERVHQLVLEAAAILSPSEGLDPRKLARRFYLRTSEGFLENFGAELISQVTHEAPLVRLHFMMKPDRDSGALRDGSVDLETGVVGSIQGPEVRATGLFRDRFVGVFREGHPLSSGDMTAQRYASGNHVLVSRQDGDQGPPDAALARIGMTRDISVVVGGFASAIALARSSDLIATVPEKHTGVLRKGMTTFSLPFAMPEMTVSLLWHPRMDADPGHRWLRRLVRDLFSSDPVRFE